MGPSVKKMRRKAKLGRGKVWALRAAASTVTIGGAFHQASAQTWSDNPVATPTVTNPGTASTTWTSNVPLKDGDAIKLESASLSSSLNQGVTYYVIGNGSTPSTTFKLAGAPGGTTPLAGPTAAATSSFVQAAYWNVAANWGGTVPNATDAVANFPTDVNTATFTYTGGNNLVGGPYGTVMLTKNTTVGTINFTGTTGDLILQSGLTANTGPLAALTFATSSGTPTVNVGSTSYTTNPKGLWFSDVRQNGTAGTPSNPGTDLVIDGTQGLTITNLNPFQPFPSYPSTSPNIAPTASAGSVKFGYGIDWSGFSGTLTLASGAFAAQAGGSSNGLSALPMNNDIVLGTNGSQAQLELNANTSSVFMRGLDGGTNSIIVNSSNGGGPALVLGSFSQPTDSYNFAGTIGTTSPYSTLGADTGAATPTALRIDKIGAGMQTLSGANYFNNGSLLLVNGGTLSLGTTGTIGTAGGSSTTSNTGTFSMHDGEFRMLGPSGSARTESFGTLQFSNGTSAGATFAGLSNGQSTITLTADPNQPNTLTFASLQPRNTSATANFNANGQTTIYQGSNLGGTPGANGVAAIKFTTSPITGTVGSTNYPVLKGALAINTTTAASGFATYDATLGSVRILASGEQDSTDPYPSSSTVVNTRLNLSSGTTTIATGVTTQTLQMDNTSGGAATVTFSGGTLNASSGFLFSGTSGTTLNGGATATVTGTAAADGEDVVFLSSSTVTSNIAIPVSNVGTSSTSREGWITYGGTGNFNITGAQTVGNSGGVAFNSTGGATLAASVTGAGSFAVNQGTVSLGTGASIQSTPDLVVAPGATFDFAGMTTQGTAFNRIDTNSVYNGVGAALSAFNSGGTVTNSSTGTLNTVTLTLGGATTTTGTFPGVISGNLNLSLARTAGGIEILSGVNTYTGGSTTIDDADNLVLGRYGQLPSTTNLTVGVSAGGTLTLGDTGGSALDGAVNQTVASIAGTATGDIVGGNVDVSVLTVNTSGTDTYAGVLGTTGANGNGNNLQLHVTGTGTLILTNNNSYTGGTVINNGGVLSVASDNTTGAIAPLGALYFPSTGATNPASAVLNNIVIDGGTLQVTATTNINSFRGIGIGQLTGSANSTGTININSGATVGYGGIIASAGNTGFNNLTKVGLGTLSLTGPSTYNGFTTVSAGTLSLSDTTTPTVLGGTGVVIVNATGAAGSTGSLTLTSAASSNPTLINPNVRIYINDPGVTNTTPMINLAFGGSAPSVNADPNNPNAPIEVVFSLNVDGASESPGYYGFGANNPNDDFTGAGEFDVISTPEPGSLGLLGLGGAMMMRRRRKTRTSVISA